LTIYREMEGAQYMMGWVNKLAEFLCPAAGASDFPRCGMRVIVEQYQGLLIPDLV